MPTPDNEAALWHAVAEMAAVWGDLPVVRRFAEQLPRNAPQRRLGLPGLLQHVTACGGMVASHPMRLGTNVPPMLSLVQGLVAPPVGPEVLDPWLEDASRVEGAHRVTVAWLRSRLPGYPQLPAPQLAQGTPLTTDEFTYRLPWTRQEFAAGFQFQNPPFEPLEILGATKNEAVRAGDTTRRLALALLETAPWRQLRDAERALLPPHRAELRSTRQAITQATRPALIDAHEPDRALPRDAYRQQVVVKAVGALSGPAREYADAFDAADRLIELVASDVFGQLAIYGTIGLAGVSELDVRGGNHGKVEFTFQDTVHPDPGTVVWLDDPLFSDAVRVTGLNYSGDQIRGTRARVTGQVLGGTAGVLPRPKP
ncbi:hypothetical protein [Kineococcus radiotolerans]|uniref:Uncharacterized protein n=1 Tax=Kineococcus radiotolerans (strain ATCC BAA-149 / DSM 14245 / SRS30216) TaxID=266940 RepID=A6WGX2_KINRD|nr:hypothetical protein Krad_4602 [Kineococcus radiotolerans SRS30216 = ATCC BAA-149]